MPSHPQLSATSHATHRAQRDEAAPMGSSSSTQVLGLLCTAPRRLLRPELSRPPRLPWGDVPKRWPGGRAHRLPFPGSLGKPCRVPKSSLMPDAVGPRAPPGWLTWPAHATARLGVMVPSKVPGPAGSAQSGWRNKTSVPQKWFSWRCKCSAGKTLTSGRSRERCSHQAAALIHFWTHHSDRCVSRSLCRPNGASLQTSALGNPLSKSF